MDKKILLKTFIIGIIVEIIGFPIFFFLVYNYDPMSMRILGSFLVPFAILTPLCCAYFLAAHSKLERQEELESLVIENWFQENNYVPSAVPQENSLLYHEIQCKSPCNSLNNLSL